MKFLIPFLATVVASSQLVFDSLAPADTGATGTPVHTKQGVAVQFRSLESCSGSMKLDYVNFTVNTVSVDNDSTWLQADLCPSVDGLPKCAPTSNPQRFTIGTFHKRVNFQWFPTTNIILEPSTKYWFVLKSNSEKKNKNPIWMDGTKIFSPETDPKRDVLTSFTQNGGADWAIDPPRVNRTVGSTRIVASIL